MPSYPPSQRAVATKRLRPSRFVQEALRRIALPVGIAALDLPAGTGRHAELLTRLGYQVTLSDIDEALLAKTQKRLQALGAACEAVVADASARLPFSMGSFDLIVITDFVDEALLGSIGTLVRLGGYLIHESYTPRGGNWQQLLRPGRTEELLCPTLKIITMTRILTGPTGSEAESVKVVATRSV